MLSRWPVFGQSSRWRFEPTTTAMGSLPDMVQEICKIKVWDFFLGELISLTLIAWSV